MQIQEINDYSHQIDEKPAMLFKTYPQRWLVLFAFASLTFVNGMAFVQYSPIMNLASQYYQVPPNYIIWFSSVYYLTYLFFAPFVIKPLQMRLDYSLILAALLTTLGYWLKFVAHQNYMVAFIGYCFIGFGQIFTLAAPPFISNIWFPNQERTMATCLGNFANLSGVNFALLYTCIRFDKSLQQQIYVWAEIEQMNFIYGVLATISLISCVLFLKNAPPSPPSYAAALTKEPMIYSYRKIISNKENIFDLVSLTIILGAAWSYVIILTILLSPYNYTTTDIGFISFYYSVSGSFGSIGASLYVDKQIAKKCQPNYDLFTKIFVSLGIIGILIQGIIINYVSDTVIIIISAIIGFGLNSFLPLCSQGLIESLFPASELVVMVALMQGANFFGFFINQIFSLDIFQNDALWILLLLLSPFYYYVIKILKTKYNRFESEKQFVQN